MARGRPKNSAIPSVSRIDETIARTAERLVMWGFSSSMVYATIASLLRGHKRSVGADRVEQIHKAWQKVPFAERSGYLIRGNRGQFKKDYLRGRAPREHVHLEGTGQPSHFVCRRRGLRDLATELLRNEGDLAPKPVTRWILEPMTLVEMQRLDIPEILRPFYAAGQPYQGDVIFHGDPGADDMTPTGWREHERRIASAPRLVRRKTG